MFSVLFGIGMFVGLCLVVTALVISLAYLIGLGFWLMASPIINKIKGTKIRRKV